MTQERAIEVLASGANVFLTGEPGAGKTFTIGRFVGKLESENKTVAITASTGIAASHLNGSTIHSWLGIGIKKNLNKSTVQYIARDPNVVGRVRMVRTLIIDEISMIDAVTLNDIDHVLKEIHGNAQPFGGIQVVLVGDFFQLPPVSRDGAAQFSFEAAAWQEADFKVCYITEQHRQSDPAFLELLSALRRGVVTDAHKDILATAAGSSEADTKLFTHNVDVDELNNAKLAELKGKEHAYMMHEEGIEKLIAVVKRNCLSPERLALKVGAIVMFTRNNFEEGYVNGTLGTVVKFDGNKPVIETKSGLMVRPTEEEWTFTEGRRVLARVTQIPLRLAWAITVHKSQGMSLDAASIDLSEAFEYGQGYVAISRVRTLGGLHLRGINSRALEVSPKVAAADAEFRAMSEELEN